MMASRRGSLRCSAVAAEWAAPWRQIVAVSDADIRAWETRIVADQAEAVAALRQMNSDDHAGFLALCRALAQHGTPGVRRVALRLLADYGDRDDQIGQQVAEMALPDLDARVDAIRALGRLGTDTAFDVLKGYAQNGERHALLAAMLQARSDEQRREVVRLARQYVLRDDFHMRMIALRCLRTFSRPEVEEDLLIGAARRHPDELTFAALRSATARALPALYAMRSAFRPGSAQHGDVSRAIQAIEARQDTRGSAPC